MKSSFRKHLKNNQKKVNAVLSLLIAGSMLFSTMAPAFASEADSVPVEVVAAGDSAIVQVGDIEEVDATYVEETAEDEGVVLGDFYAPEVKASTELLPKVTTETKVSEPIVLEETYYASSEETQSTTSVSSTSVNTVSETPEVVVEEETLIVEETEAATEEAAEEEIEEVEEETEEEKAAREAEEQRLAEEAFEKALEEYTVTNSYAHDLYTLAQSQLGRKEIWSASFLIRLMDLAGVQGVATDEDLEKWVDALKEAEAAATEAAEAIEDENEQKAAMNDIVRFAAYDPETVQTADLVFFRTEENGRIVRRVGLYDAKNFHYDEAEMSKPEDQRKDNREKGLLYVISGDTENTVAEVEYNLIDSTYVDENGDVQHKALYSEVLEDRMEESADADLTKVLFLGHTDAVIEGIVTLPLTEEEKAAQAEEAVEEVAEETEEVEATEEIAEETKDATEVKANEEKAEEEKIVAGELKAKSVNFDVTMSYTEEAGIPEGASLRVRELRENSAEYNEVKAMFDEQLGEVPEDTNTKRAIIDITILDAKGNEIEPNASVDVKVEVRKAETHPERYTGEVTVTHLEEKKVEEPIAVEVEANVTTIEVETVVETTNEVGEIHEETAVLEVSSEIEFTVDSFSFFDLKWTESSGQKNVRFFYGFMVDGEFHEFPRDMKMGADTYWTGEYVRDVDENGNETLKLDDDGNPIKVMKSVASTGGVVTTGWNDRGVEQGIVVDISSGDIPEQYKWVQFNLGLGDGLPAKLSSSKKIGTYRLDANTAANIKDNRILDHINEGTSGRIKDVLIAGPDLGGDSGWVEQGTELYWRYFPYKTTNSENNESIKFNDGDEVYVIYDYKPEFNVAGKTEDGDTIYGGTNKIDTGNVSVDELGEPEHSKKMTPNNDGDGTYTVELDVTGKSNVKNAENKSDIIIVLDVTGSLRYQLWGERYGSYQGKTRADLLFDVVRDLTNELISYNEEHPGAVEMSLIVFNNHASVVAQNISDPAEARRKIGNAGQYWWWGSTNWEEGLLKVSDIRTRADAEQHVIFLTDGQPTQRATALWQYTREPDYAQRINMYFDSYGRANETNWGNDNATAGRPGAYGQMDNNAIATYAYAKEIVASGMNFTTIGAFLDDRQRLIDVANAAQNATPKPGITKGEVSSYEGTNYESFMDEALRPLIEKVTGKRDYSNVKITDTITERTAKALVNGKATNLVHYRYYEDLPASKPQTANDFVGSGSWGNNNADTTDKTNTGAYRKGVWNWWSLSDEDRHKYLLPGLNWETMKQTPPAEGSAELEALIEQALVSFSGQTDEAGYERRKQYVLAHYKDYYIWQDAPDAAEKNRDDVLDGGIVDNKQKWIKKAKYVEDGEGKKVFWDISYGNGDPYSLEPGMTYKVGFTVWPDQDSYDLISDIKNGYVTVTQTETIDGKETIKNISYATNAPRKNYNVTTLKNIYKQGNDYYLFSNERNNNPANADKVYLEWTETLTQTGGSGGNGASSVSGKSPYTRPDGMILEDAKIKVKKTWSVNGDEDNKKLKAFLRKNGSLTANLELKRKTGKSDGNGNVYYLPNGDIALTLSAADVNAGTTEKIYSNDIYVSVGLAVSDPVNIDTTAAPATGYTPVQITMPGASTATTFYTLDSGWTYFLHEKNYTPASANITYTGDKFYPVLLDGVLYDIDANGNATPHNENFMLTGRNVFDANFEYEIRVEKYAENGTTKITDKELTFVLKNEDTGDSMTRKIRNGAGNDLTAEGYLLWENLEDGLYSLEETEVPQGYVNNQFKIYFRIVDGEIVMASPDGQKPVYAADITVNAKGQIMIGGQQVYADAFAETANITTNAQGGNALKLVNKGTTDVVTNPVAGGSYAIYIGKDNNNKHWYLTNYNANGAQEENGTFPMKALSVDNPEDATAKWFDFTVGTKDGVKALQLNAPTDGADGAWANSHGGTTHTWIYNGFAYLDGTNVKAIKKSVLNNVAFRNAGLILDMQGPTGNNNTITFKIKNEREYPELTVKKVDKDGNVIASPENGAAKFYIKKESRPNGIPLYLDYEGNGIYKIDFTNKKFFNYNATEGEFLQEGVTYYLYEENAPEGYELISDKGIPFQITFDGRITFVNGDANYAASNSDLEVMRPTTLNSAANLNDGTITVVNKKAVNVKIKKVDENDQPLGGAAFTLKKSTGVQVGDPQGPNANKTEFDFTLTEPNEYFIEETTTPANYKTSDERFAFTLNNLGEITTKGVANVSVGANGQLMIGGKAVYCDSSIERKEYFNTEGKGTPVILIKGFNGPAATNADLTKENENTKFWLKVGNEYVQGRRVVVTPEKTDYYQTYLRLPDGNWRPSVLQESNMYYELKYVRGIPVLYCPSTVHLSDPGYLYLIGNELRKGDKDNSGEKILVSGSNVTFDADTNTYTVKVVNEPNPVEFEIEAHKTLLDGNGNAQNITEGQFEFTLRGKTGNEPMPEGTDENGVVKVGNRAGTAADGAKVLFGSISFDREGEYSYIIQEIAGDNDDMDYDIAEREVLIKVVKNSQGKLVATVEYSKTITQKTEVTTASAFQANKKYILTQTVDGTEYALGIKNNEPYWLGDLEKAATDETMQWTPVYSGSSFYLKNVSDGGFITTTSDQRWMAYSKSYKTLLQLVTSGSSHGTSLAYNDSLGGWVIKMASGSYPYIGGTDGTTEYSDAKKIYRYGDVYEYTDSYGKKHTCGTRTRIYTFETTESSDSVPHDIINKGTPLTPIQLKKKDANRENDIYGAQFTLYTKAEYQAMMGGSSVVGDVRDDATAQTATFTWGEKKDGEYVIVETRAATGYIKLSDPIYVNIVRGRIVLGQRPSNVGFDANGVYIEVPNNPVQYKVKLFKVNVDEPTKKLDGAQFNMSLLKTAANATTTAAHGVYTKTDADIVEGANNFTIPKSGWTKDGLGEGWYIIEETKAPVGFVIATEPWFVKATPKFDEATGNYIPDVTYYKSRVAEEGETENLIIVNDKRYIVEIMNQNADESVNLENKPIYELPSSGGPGTYLFTILGTMLMVLAVAYAYMRLQRARVRSRR